MREKHTNSVQNRFTAYLMAAVGNTRMKYWERFHIEPKQAEMAYYYVLRKLRKEMRGKNEF